jgi:hypothetical protein
MAASRPRLMSNETVGDRTLITHSMHVTASPLRPIAALFLLAAVLLGSASGHAQTLGPAPDPTDPIWFGAEPPTPDECFRFGLRYWIKKNLVDKKAACACVKCGWTAHLPPHRLCWRTC